MKIKLTMISCVVLLMLASCLAPKQDCIPWCLQCLGWQAYEQVDDMPQGKCIVLLNYHGHYHAAVKLESDEYGVLLIDNGYLFPRATWQPWSWWEKHGIGCGVKQIEKLSRHPKINPQYVRTERWRDR